MTDQPRDPTTLTPAADWPGAQPEVIPPPTISPAALGLGSTLLVWGIISSWVISAVGLVVFALALIGWIRDIRHERAQ